MRRATRRWERALRKEGVRDPFSISSPSEPTTPGTATWGLATATCTACTDACRPSTARATRSATAWRGGNTNNDQQSLSSDQRFSRARARGARVCRSANNKGHRRGLQGRGDRNEQKGDGRCLDQVAGRALHHVPHVAAANGIGGGKKWLAQCWATRGCTNYYIFFPRALVDRRVIHRAPQVVRVAGCREVHCQPHVHHELLPQHSLLKRDAAKCRQELHEISELRGRKRGEPKGRTEGQGDAPRAARRGGRGTRARAARCCPPRRPTQIAAALRA